jgi:hypothetical protein
MTPEIGPILPAYNLRSVRDIIRIGRELRFGGSLQ